MKKTIFVRAFSAVLTLAAVVTACETDKLDTTQIEDTTEVVLTAYGPRPVVRGGVLRFVGSNLDQVASVTLPGCDPLTNITVVKAGVPSEIQITVPVEGPRPGDVVLTTKGGKQITAETPLTYTEAILLTGFSPAALYPGETLTIEGDYLNNIHEVIFTSKVKVSEADFLTHTRYKVEVVVPAEARTGVVGVGTIDESVETEADLLASLNVVESEDEFTVKTAEGAITSTPVKAGETVTISGTRLDLVTAVYVGHTEIEDFTATESTLTFTLDPSVADGEILLEHASGVSVSAGELSAVVPGNLSASPAPVKNGQTLVITGDDLDLVTVLDFPNSAGAEFSYADGEITVAVTEAAQAGDIVLHTANGNSSTVAYTLVEPVVTGFSENPAAAGSFVTIFGTDLDLVAGVSFAGADPVEVESSEEAITVAVPTAAESGVVVLNLKNGASLETLEIAVDKPAGAYIANMPETLYSPGDMFIIDIENADHLTGVQFDGVDANYILGGTTLYVQIPSDAKANTTITLVSDNGSVTYAMNIDPGDFIVTPIWTGSASIGSWGGMQDLSWGGYDWSSVAPGTILRLQFTPDVAHGEWYCIHFRSGTSWAALAGVETQYDNPGSPFDIVLTQEILDDLIANNGLVLTGYMYTLTEVDLVEDLRYGTTIWEGGTSIGSWGGMQDLAWGGYDWSSVSVGQTLFLHFTPDVAEGDWYCIHLRTGTSWDALAGVPAQYDNPESPMGVILTREILDDLIANDGLVLTGYMYTITKVSLK